MPDDSATQHEPEVLKADGVADLVQELPEVNAAAIDAAREQEAQAHAGGKQAAPAAPAAAAPAASVPPAPAAATTPQTAAEPKAKRTKVAPTDEKGRPFDPCLHECTDDGEPIFRSYPNDRWLRCRRQPLKEWKRKSVVAEDVPPQPEQPQVHEPVVDTAKQMAAAATMAGLQIMAMRVALGDKIAQTEAERSELTNSWLSVFQHYGVGGTFHPVVGLALVSGSIVVGALHHEDTRSRLTRIWQWTQLKVVSLWWRIRGRKAKPAAKAEPEKPAEPESEPQRAAA